MPIRDDTDDIIAYLNGLVALDRDFMHSLISFRISCGQAISDHPTVQAGLKDGTAVAGLLGVLNGYFGTYCAGPYNGYGPITAHFDNSGDKKLTKFTRTDEAVETWDHGKDSV